LTQDFDEIHELLLTDGTEVFEELVPEPRRHNTVVKFASNILTVLQIIGIFWFILGGDRLIRMTGYRGALPKFYWTIQV
jgi:hypothetical protein